jgi:hypothetical protein
MPLARADLESLLRTRQLDRTLTSALPPPPAADADRDATTAATGDTTLDAYLGGGFPRGQVSELTGPRSSGRASVVLSALAAATARGELTAIIDLLDMFDVDSAAAAGVVLDRLLWVRGHVVINPGMCRDSNQRAIEQAMRACALVLQAGNFGLVVFDAAEAPADAIRRLPFTTWLRLQRMVEGSSTACVLVGSEPMARSAAGLSIRTSTMGIGDWGLGIGDHGIGNKGIRNKGIGDRGIGDRGIGEREIADRRIGERGTGGRFTGRMFDGLDVRAKVVRARAGRPVEGSVQLTTRASHA